MDQILFWLSIIKHSIKITAYVYQKINVTVFLWGLDVEGSSIEMDFFLGILTYRTTPKINTCKLSDETK